MSIGKQIQTYRKEAGLTQEALAETVHVSAQAVSNWERDLDAPDVFKIVDIARALNVGAGRLLEETPPIKNKKWVRLFSEDRMYTYAKTVTTERKLYQTARALPYAREKHRGQKKKGEQKEVEFINHPLTMVCQALSMELYDDDLLSALILHDVIEDTDTKLEDLPVRDEAKELVRLMTKVPDAEDREAAEQAYYRELAKNPKAALIKCFDRVNNLSNMALGFSRERMAAYVDDTENNIVPLIRVIKDKAPEYSHIIWLLSYQMYSLLETYKRLL